jgi:hypothetical protein
VRHGKINGLAQGQAGIELVADFNRAHSGTLAATDTTLGIDHGGFLAQGHQEFPRFPFQPHQFGPQQDLNIFVEQSAPQAVLRRRIALHQRQHLAHAAVVAGKLVIQLGQSASQARRPIDERHP